MDFFVSGGEPPEDMKAQMLDAIDRQKMSQEALRHAIPRFISEQSADDLTTLRSVISMCGGDDTGNVGSYYEGLITAALQYKYNVCSGCGLNHDADILGAVGTSQDTPATEDRPAPDRLSDGPLYEDVKMKEYNVRRPNDTDPDISKGPDDDPMICIGCGTLFQSLDDRLLRPAGANGCAGCVHKTKWG